MTIRILALDQSGLTGWCHGVPGAPPAEVVSGTFKVPAGQPTSKRARRLYRFVREMIEANEIGKVVFETPILPKITSFDAVSSLTAYAVAIAWAADDFGLVAVPVPMQIWRSAFGVATQAPRKIKVTAERRAWVKDQTLVRCRALGFDPKDDNAADAIGLWWTAAEKVSRIERAPEFDLFASASI